MVVHVQNFLPYSRRGVLGGALRFSRAEAGPSHLPHSSCSECRDFRLGMQLPHTSKLHVTQDMNFPVTTPPHASHLVIPLVAAISNLTFSQTYLASAMNSVCTRGAGTVPSAARER